MKSVVNFFLNLALMAQLSCIQTSLFGISSCLTFENIEKHGLYRYIEKQFLSNEDQCALYILLEKVLI